MKLRFSLLLATLSASAFGQTPYQIGYAANLNIGDSVVNISNSGQQGGFFGATPPTVGNICVNAYVFDPQEEEIGCCSCLVTPNGLNSLSAKSDLTSNNLTPAVPLSIVIKLLATEPGIDATGAFTICNPARVGGAGLTAATPIASVTAADPYYSPLPTPPSDPNVGFLASGLLAWGTTIEPSVGAAFGVVNVPYIPSVLSSSELFSLQQLCNFIQANGSGFGICRSCRLGALGGAKQ